MSGSIASQQVNTGKSRPRLIQQDMVDSSTGLMRTCSPITKFNRIVSDHSMALTGMNFFMVPASVLEIVSKQDQMSASA